MHYILILCKARRTGTETVCVTVKWESGNETISKKPEQKVQNLSQTRRCQYWAEVTCNRNTQSRGHGILCHWWKHTCAAPIVNCSNSIVADSCFCLIICRNHNHKTNRNRKTVANCKMKQFQNSSRVYGISELIHHNQSTDGGHGSPMSKWLAATSVPRSSLCPTVQPDTSPLWWAKSTARTTSPTQHVRPLGFRHCWSVCLEQSSGPCDPVRNPNSTEAAFKCLLDIFVRTVQAQRAH